MQEQIRLYLAKRFGRSSEQRFPEHPSLFDEAEQEAEAHPEAESAEEAQGDAGKDEEIAIAGHVRRKHGRQPLPEFLPRMEVIDNLWR